MKKIEWAKMDRKGQVEALEEFGVRVDELNEHAPNLDRVVVARRLYELMDDLLDVLYEREEGDGEDVPATGAIYDRLYSDLESREE